MRDSDHLPPLMNFVSIVGCLFILVALAVSGLGLVAWFSSSQSSLDSVRVFVITSNLFVLSFTCTSTVVIYRARVRQPDRGPFLLDSWQMRVIAVLAALSICTLVLAVVLPSTAVAFVIVLPIWNLAAFGVIIVTLGSMLRRQAVG